MLVGIIIVIALALAVVLVVLGRRSSSPAAGGAEPRAGIGSDVFEKLHLAPVDFTVEADTAIVSFDVPLPPGDVDPVLADVLIRQAVEVVREKRARGLPLDDITTVRVLGRRDGIPVEAAVLSLEEPGSLPPPPDGKLPEVKEAEEVEFDPLHRLADHVGKGQAPAVSVSRGDELPPLQDEVRLTASLEDAVRAKGVSPESMRASDLTLALLEAAGYQVTAGSASGTYMATRAGTRTFIGVVDHEPGGYPELAESAVNSFLASFYSAGADRGLLFSDKFCPHLVYEKERRDPRVKFITRERMQAFVDTIAVL